MQRIELITRIYSEGNTCKDAAEAMGMDYENAK
jgi:molybdenum-dependent DNA-binding transcriptional regulator ModE